jgi:hypothetical protein
MIHLFQYISSQLSQHGEVHLEQATKKAKFPYIVYRFDTSANAESNREDFPLVINVWDNQTDTTRLELLADAVDKTFKGLRYMDEHQQLTFVKAGRAFLTDPDPDIRGRQIRYIIQTYER